AFNWAMERFVIVFWGWTIGTIMSRAMGISFTLSFLSSASAISSFLISREELAISQEPSRRALIPFPEPLPSREKATLPLFASEYASIAFWVIGRTVVEPLITTLLAASG